MALCLLATLLCTKAWATDPPAWQAFVTEASQRFGIPADWIMAVIEAESGGQTMLNGAPITSPAGAMGLMQVMPETYAELRERHDLGADPYDPRDNILAGTAYLAEMYQRYGYPWCFAAYNAGPQRLDSYLELGRRLPQETLIYLTKIETNLQTAPLERLAGGPNFAASQSLFIDQLARRSSLFFVLGNDAQE